MDIGAFIRDRHGRPLTFFGAEARIAREVAIVVREVLGRSVQVVEAGRHPQDGEMYHLEIMDDGGDLSSDDQAAVNAFIKHFRVNSLGLRRGRPIFCPVVFDERMDLGEVKAACATINVVTGYCASPVKMGTGYGISVHPGSGNMMADSEYYKVVGVLMALRDYRLTIREVDNVDAEEYEMEEATA